MATAKHANGAADPLDMRGGRPPFGAREASDSLLLVRSHRSMDEDCGSRNNHTICDVRRPESVVSASGRMHGSSVSTRHGSAQHILVNNTNGRRCVLVRTASMPLLRTEPDDPAIHRIFPDVNPRDLRIAEVRSWYCAWMEPKTKDQEEELEQEIGAIADELAQEQEQEHSEVSVPVPVRSVKRPQLRLKLEDMPTAQQAEDRAQRAAHRIVQQREAVAQAMENGNGMNGGKASAGQQAAAMRLNFKSYSSGDDSDLQSPNGGRSSVGSAYSPNHGMFTTKTVAISEAGISSPDSACLHLQENLERVSEIGRGASGIVYKAIHIPTLKVVAIKDVPVYGRGQRRQMVRELHALYSNLVPISDEESPGSTPSREFRGDARPKASPQIVSFYDAFVDRPKNCICLVMEYMGAGSLQDIVLRGGCQNEKILSRLAGGVLRGLAHIHNKHMVHRDIKPHNLLTNRMGEVKISDFGLAKTLNDNAGVTKTFVGTVLYMAPERINGGDYSYSADVWSFGLALIAVALGRYPLPTQDGFFGLVDSVANEKFLELPEDQYSEDCRHFVEACLRIEPEERPSAVELLRHPFITKYSPDDTLREWLRFVEEKHLCEDRATELESLADAVHRHIYEQTIRFSHQPQSDYGMSLLSHAPASFSRRDISIPPVQMSLQLGLANYLGLPVQDVYDTFESKRCVYTDKLLEDYCYSPQSWTASPGLARRHQLFGTGSDTPSPSRGERSPGSFWHKVQDSLAKFKNKRKLKKEAKAAERKNSGTRRGSLR